MHDVQPETRQNPCSHRTPILPVGIGSKQDKLSVFLDLSPESAEPHPPGPESVVLGSGLTISIPTSSHLKLKLLQTRGPHLENSKNWYYAPDSDKCHQEK